MVPVWILQPCISVNSFISDWTVQNFTHPPCVSGLQEQSDWYIQASSIFLYLMAYEHQDIFFLSKENVLKSKNFVSQVFFNL